MRMAKARGERSAHVNAMRVEWVAPPPFPGWRLSAFRSGESLQLCPEGRWPDEQSAPLWRGLWLWVDETPGPVTAERRERQLQPAGWAHVASCWGRAAPDALSVDLVAQDNRTVVVRVTFDNAEEAARLALVPERAPTAFAQLHAAQLQQQWRTAVQNAPLGSCFAAFPVPGGLLPNHVMVQWAEESGARWSKRALETLLRAAESSRPSGVPVSEINRLSDAATLPAWNVGYRRDLLYPQRTAADDEWSCLWHAPFPLHTLLGDCEDVAQLTLTTLFALRHHGFFPDVFARYEPVLATVVLQPDEGPGADQPEKLILHALAVLVDRVWLTDEHWNNARLETPPTHAPIPLESALALNAEAVPGETADNLIVPAVALRRCNSRPLLYRACISLHTARGTRLLSDGEALVRSKVAGHAWDQPWNVRLVPHVSERTQQNVGYDAALRELQAYLPQPRVPDASGSTTCNAERPAPLAGFARARDAEAVKAAGADAAPWFSLWGGELELWRVSASRRNGGGTEGTLHQDGAFEAGKDDGEVDVNLELEGMSVYVDLDTEETRTKWLTRVNEREDLLQWAAKVCPGDAALDAALRAERACAYRLREHFTKDGKFAGDGDEDAAAALQELVLQTRPPLVAATNTAFVSAFVQAREQKDGSAAFDTAVFLEGVRVAEKELAERRAQFEAHELADCKANGTPGEQAAALALVHGLKSEKDELLEQRVNATMWSKGMARLLEAKGRGKWSLCIQEMATLFVVERRRSTLATRVAGARATEDTLRAALQRSMARAVRTMNVTMPVPGSSVDVDMTKVMRDLKLRMQDCKAAIERVSARKGATQDELTEDLRTVVATATEVADCAMAFKQHATWASANADATFELEVLGQTFLALQKDAKPDDSESTIGGGPSLGSVHTTVADAKAAPVATATDPALRELAEVLDSVQKHVTTLTSISDKLADVDTPPDETEVRKSDQQATKINEAIAAAVVKLDEIAARATDATAAAALVQSIRDQVDEGSAQHGVVAALVAKWDATAAAAAAVAAASAAPSVDATVADATRAIKEEEDKIGTALQSANDALAAMQDAAAVRTTVSMQQLHAAVDNARETAQAAFDRATAARDAVAEGAPGRKTVTTQLNAAKSGLDLVKQRSERSGELLRAWLDAEAAAAAAQRAAAEAQQRTREIQTQLLTIDTQDATLASAITAYDNATTQAARDASLKDAQNAREKMAKALAKAQRLLGLIPAPDAALRADITAREEADKKAGERVDALVATNDIRRLAAEALERVADAVAAAQARIANIGAHIAAIGTDDDWPAAAARVEEDIQAVVDAKLAYDAERVAVLKDSKNNHQEWNDLTQELGLMRAGIAVAEPRAVAAKKLRADADVAAVHNETARVATERDAARRLRMLVDQATATDAELQSVVQNMPSVLKRATDAVAAVNAAARFVSQDGAVQADVQDAADALAAAQKSADGAVALAQQRLAERADTAAVEPARVHLREVAAARGRAATALGDMAQMGDVSTNETRANKAENEARMASARLAAANALLASLALASDAVRTAVASELKVADGEVAAAEQDAQAAATRMAGIRAAATALVAADAAVVDGEAKLNGFAAHIAAIRNSAQWADAVKAAIQAASDCTDALKPMLAEEKIVLADAINTQADWDALVRRKDAVLAKVQHFLADVDAARKVRAAAEQTANAAQAAADAKVLTGMDDKRKKLDTALGAVDTAIASPIQAVADTATTRQAIEDAWIVAAGLMAELELLARTVMLQASQQQAQQKVTDAATPFDACSQRVQVANTNIDGIDAKVQTDTADLDAAKDVVAQLKALDARLLDAVRHIEKDDTWNDAYLEMEKEVAPAGTHAAGGVKAAEQVAQGGGLLRADGAAVRQQVTDAHRAVQEAWKLVQEAHAKRKAAELQAQANMPPSAEDARRAAAIIADEAEAKDLNNSSGKLQAHATRAQLFLHQWGGHDSVLAAEWGAAEFLTAALRVLEALKDFDITGKALHTALMAERAFLMGAGGPKKGEAVGDQERQLKAAVAAARTAHTPAAQQVTEALDAWKATQDAFDEALFGRRHVRLDYMHNLINQQDTDAGRVLHALQNHREWWDADRAAWSGFADVDPEEQKAPGTDDHKRAAHARWEREQACGAFMNQGRPLLARFDECVTGMSDHQIAKMEGKLDDKKDRCLDDFEQSFEDDWVHGPDVTALVTLREAADLSCVAEWNELYAWLLYDECDHELSVWERAVNPHDIDKFEEERTAVATLLRQAMRLQRQLRETADVSLATALMKQHTLCVNAALRCRENRSMRSTEDTGMPDELKGYDNVYNELQDALTQVPDTDDFNAVLGFLRDGYAAKVKWDAALDAVARVETYGVWHTAWKARHAERLRQLNALEKAISDRLYALLRNPGPAAHDLDTWAFAARQLLEHEAEVPADGDWSKWWAKREDGLTVWTLLWSATRLLQQADDLLPPFDPAGSTHDERRDNVQRWHARAESALAALSLRDQLVALTLRLRVAEFRWRLIHQHEEWVFACAHDATGVLRRVVEITVGTVDEFDTTLDRIAAWEREAWALVHRNVDGVLPLLNEGNLAHALDPPLETRTLWLARRMKAGLESWLMQGTASERWLKVTQWSNSGLFYWPLYDCALFARWVGMDGDLFAGSWANWDDAMRKWWQLTDSEGRAHASDTENALLEWPDAKAVQLNPPASTQRTQGAIDGNVFVKLEGVALLLEVRNIQHGNDCLAHALNNLFQRPGLVTHELLLAATTANVPAIEGEPKGAHAQKSQDFDIRAGQNVVAALGYELREVTSVRQYSHLLHWVAADSDFLGFVQGNRVHFVAWMRYRGYWALLDSSYNARIGNAADFRIDEDAWRDRPFAGRVFALVRAGGDTSQLLDAWNIWDSMAFAETPWLPVPLRPLIHCVAKQKTEASWWPARNSLSPLALEAELNWQAMERQPFFLQDVDGVDDNAQDGGRPRVEQLSADGTHWIAQQTFPFARARLVQDWRSSFLDRSGLGNTLQPQPRAPWQVRLVCEEELLPIDVVDYEALRAAWQWPALVDMRAALRTHLDGVAQYVHNVHVCRWTVAMHCDAYWPWRSVGDDLDCLFIAARWRGTLGDPVVDSNTAATAPTIATVAEHLKIALKARDAACFATYASEAEAQAAAVALVTGWTDDQEAADRLFKGVTNEWGPSVARAMRDFPEMAATVAEGVAERAVHDAGVWAPEDKTRRRETLCDRWRRSAVALWPLQLPTWRALGRAVDAMAVAELRDKGKALLQITKLWEEWTSAVANETGLAGSWALDAQPTRNVIGQHADGWFLAGADGDERTAGRVRSWMEQSGVWRKPEHGWYVPFTPLPHAEQAEADAWRFFRYHWWKEDDMGLGGDDDTWQQPFLFGAGGGGGGAAFKVPGADAAERQMWKDRAEQANRERQLRRQKRLASGGAAKGKKKGKTKKKKTKPAAPPAPVHTKAPPVPPPPLPPVTAGDLASVLNDIDPFYAEERMRREAADWARALQRRLFE